MNEWQFGRKISYAPLIKSIGFSAILGLASVPFIGTYWAIGIWLAGFMVLALGYYPAVLWSQYGHWDVTAGKVSFYRYNTWPLRIRAIFAPHHVATDSINLGQVHKARLVQGKEVIESKDILAFNYAPEFYMPWMRTQRYIEITLEDGTHLYLDLSGNRAHQIKSDANVTAALSYLNEPEFSR